MNDILKAPLKDGTGYINPYTLYNKPLKGDMGDFDPNLSEIDIPFGPSEIKNLGHYRIADKGINSKYLESGLGTAIISMLRDALKAEKEYKLAMLSVDIMLKPGNMPSEKIIALGDPLFLSGYSLDIPTQLGKYIDNKSTKNYNENGLTSSTKNWLNQTTQFSKDNEFPAGIAFVPIDRNDYFVTGLNPNPQQGFDLCLKGAKYEPVGGRLRLDKTIKNIQIMDNPDTFESDLYAEIKGGY
ncbi:MAG: hypothetical protein K0B02_00010 [DPANN group archaeon]|nr:hypothetical protein [DPANN group archaeon]